MRVCLCVRCSVHAKWPVIALIINTIQNDIFEKLNFAQNSAIKHNRCGSVCLARFLVIILQFLVFLYFGYCCFVEVSIGLRHGWSGQHNSSFIASNWMVSESDGGLCAFDIGLIRSCFVFFSLLSVGWRRQLQQYRRGAHQPDRVDARHSGGISSQMPSVDTAIARCGANAATGHRAALQRDHIVGRGVHGMKWMAIGLFSVRPRTTQSISCILLALFQAVGFRGDIGYQTFLYSNVIEVRRVFMFLIEQLPKEAEKARFDTQPKGKICRSRRSNVSYIEIDQSHRHCRQIIAAGTRHWPEYQHTNERAMDAAVLQEVRHPKIRQHRCGAGVQQRILADKSAHSVFQ